jgi:Pentapeptide repeats (9 copies)
MRVLVPQARPEPFREGVARQNHVWSVAFFAFDWFWEWVAYFLGNWKFLEVLEYLGSFSVLVAVLFYFSESGDRTKQKHYQAWQVINTAQGKGGSGGRVDALQELNTDHIPLIGVDVSGGFLQAVDLRGAKLLRSNFSAADMRNSNLNGADLTDANLQSANLRDSALERVEFTGADLSASDLTRSDLAESDLTGATLNDADMHEANLRAFHWQGILSIKGADIHGVKNAPDGFVDWALDDGATAHPAEDNSAPRSK